MPKVQQNRLLKNKGEFTKFQILFEVMRNQPHVKQKDISDKLGITIQAISKYFKNSPKRAIEAGPKELTTTDPKKAVTN
jgi:predicted transcriptional regulator